MRYLILSVVFASAAAYASAEFHSFEIFVTFEDKPLVGLHLNCMAYEDGETTQAITDVSGVATLCLREETINRLNRTPLSPFMFRINESDSFSQDFVLLQPSIRGNGMHVDVVRSAVWQMRATPRACDELARIGDIPVGSLPALSAADYNQWYSELDDETLQTCRDLTRLQSQVGSLAPWYFYAYTGQYHQCVEGKAHEIDWATWYRDLLTEATGANPGECERDWLQWWSSKGYAPIPEHPRPK